MIDAGWKRPAQVALAIWIGVFVAFLGTTVTTFNEELRVIAIWVYGLPVIVAAVYCLIRHPARLDGAVAVSIAIFVVVAWLSTDRIASLETIGLVVGYASVFVLACRLSSPDWRAAVAVGVCLPATIWLLALGTVWIFDLGKAFALGGSLPPLVARSAHMWLGTDLVAVLLLLSIPFFPWIAWRALRHTLIGATIVAAVAVIPLSHARTTWIAFAVGGLVLIALTPQLRGRIWPANRVPLGVAGVVLGLVAVTIAATGSLGALSGRTYIWQSALATIESSPFVGTGPGTFSWTRLAEAPPLLGRFPVFQAHNVVLQTLADGGVLLFAGLALVCISWLAMVVPVASTLNWRTRIAIATLAAFALILMLDDPTQLPALTVMALILAGWTAGDSLRARPFVPPRRPVRWISAMVLGGAAIIGLPSIFAASEARTAAAQARVAAVDGDWQAAFNGFSRASDSWPSRAPYELGMGLAASHLGDVEAARDHYEAAAALSPGDPRPLGAVAALTDSPDDRIELLREASQLGTKDPQYSYRLARDLAQLGRQGDAAHEMARAAMLDPQILALVAESDGNTLDRVLAALPPVLADEAELAFVDVPAVLAQARVAQGLSDEESPPLFEALTTARLGELDRAQDAAATALERDPFDPRSYGVGIAIADARCDDSEAKRLERLSQIAPGAFVALYRIGAEVRESRDHVYREMGLGDYQPPGTDRPSVSPYEWPRAFVTGIGCVSVDETP